MIITLEIKTTKEIKDIEDRIAGRIYSMEGIETVKVVSIFKNYQQVSQDKRSEK